MSAPKGAAGDEGSERLHIDYVLGYRSNLPAGSLKAKDDYKLHAPQIRMHYEDLLSAQGFNIRERKCGDYKYLLLHCSSRRLIKEGEKMQLKMPLRDCPIDHEGCGLMAWLCNASGGGACGCLSTGKSVSLEASATVDEAHLQLFKGGDNTATFFRPAVRSLLVRNILLETDVSELCFLTGDCVDMTREDKVHAKRGLSFLLNKGVYDFASQLPDAYTLPGPSGLASLPCQEADSAARQSVTDDQLEAVGPSLTAEMRRLRWCNIFGFQLVTCVREYYGEEIAIYFAWSAMLAQMLAVPAVLGLILFVLGLVFQSADARPSGVFSSPMERGNMSVSSTVGDAMTNVSLVTPGSVTSAADPVTALENLYDEFLNYVHYGVDNIYVWSFGFVICIWGTVFVEAWKRQSAVLAYMWHVHKFKSRESPRPQFYGTVKIRNGHESLEDNSSARYWVWRSVSLAVIVILAGFAVLIAILLSDVRLKINSEICSEDQKKSGYCSAAIVSTMVLNIIVTMVTDRVCSILARKLTDWENHKTQTRYRNELATKLVVFSAINDYFPLYYITFFQGNVEVFRPWSILGLNADESGRCGKYRTCLPLLSVQLAMLTFAKPLWRLFCKLVIWLVRLCKEKRKSNSPHNDRGAALAANRSTGTVDLDQLLNGERNKQPMDDFTLSRYLQRIILYGHMMLFGVSLPLAPLLVLIIHVIEHALDIHEMINTRRRPAALIAQDIGIWRSVMELANMVGVVTSCHLMATMNSNPLKTGDYGKLLFALVLIVLLLILKGCISECIPDVPEFVLDARKQEKRLVKEKFGRSWVQSASAPALNATDVAVSLGETSFAAGNADDAAGMHCQEPQTRVRLESESAQTTRLYPDLRRL